MMDIAARQLAALRKTGEHWRQAARILFKIKSTVCRSVSAGVAASAISAFGDRWRLSLCVFDNVVGRNLNSSQSSSSNSDHGSSAHLRRQERDNENYLYKPYNNF